MKESRDALRTSFKNPATTRPGGVLSAVYGGAVHPSAEGHAAMADAALPAAAAVLQLDAEAEVISQPVPPVGTPR